MYWNDKDVPMGMKDKLTSLLWEGKIEIVGGGWVQHDETLTTYKMQLANIETGINWLYDTFPFL